MPLRILFLLLLPLAPIRAQQPDLVGIYVATVDAFWGNRTADSDAVSVAYNFYQGIAEPLLPGPLFDTTAMREAGIEPAIVFVPVVDTLSKIDRERLEKIVLERKAIRLWPFSSVERSAIPDDGSPRGFWKGFRTRYPDTHDMLGLSRIALDSSGTFATVEAGVSCGIRCGHATAFLLHRDNGTWKVVMPSRVTMVH